jgi:septal ring-binding cell division protein DamX
VLYVAYVTIDKQLQSIKDESIAEIKTLQSSMTELQQTVASGGSPDLFVQLEDKVLVLETTLNAIQAQLTQSNAQPVLPAVVGEIASVTEMVLPISEGEQAMAKAQLNPITEAVLDQKLAVLEQKIDQKLEIILKHLLQDSAGATEVAGAATKAKPQPTLAVTEPSSPTLAELKTPETPALPLQDVKKVDAPTEPAKPAAAQKPLKNYTSDVQWLMNEPPLNYTMQLASTNDQALLNKMIKQHQLTDSKIISQTRNNVKSYVLVSGSFTSRKDADSMAKEFKNKYGIAPWVRKIRDITNRIE